MKWTRMNFLRSDSEVGAMASARKKILAYLPKAQNWHTTVSNKM